MTSHYLVDSQWPKTQTPCTGKLQTSIISCRTTRIFNLTQNLLVCNNLLYSGRRNQSTATKLAAAHISSAMLASLFLIYVLPSLKQSGMHPQRTLLSAPDLYQLSTIAVGERRESAAAAT
ncbi:MAG: hypothetical protein MHMPM18_001652 [Marteilia pararefringens]